MEKKFAREFKRICQTREFIEYHKLLGGILNLVSNLLNRGMRRHVNLCTVKICRNTLFSIDFESVFFQLGSTVAVRCRVLLRYDCLTVRTVVRLPYDYHTTAVWLSHDCDTSVVRLSLDCVWLLYDYRSTVVRLPRDYRLTSVRPSCDYRSSKVRLSYDCGTTAARLLHDCGTTAVTTIAVRLPYGTTVTRLSHDYCTTLVVLPRSCRNSAIGLLTGSHLNLA